MILVVYYYYRCCYCCYKIGNRSSLTLQPDVHRWLSYISLIQCYSVLEKCRIIQQSSILIFPYFSTYPAVSNWQYTGIKGTKSFNNSFVVFGTDLQGLEYIDVLFGAIKLPNFTGRRLAGGTFVLCSPLQLPYFYIQFRHLSYVSACCPILTTLTHMT